jgi:hypothetical protein
VREKEEEGNGGRMVSVDEGQSRGGSHGLIGNGFIGGVRP